VNIGAWTTSAVSGKTSILLVGSKLEDGWEVTEGSKYVKAKTLATKIMTEDEFELFLWEKIPNPNFVIENYKEWYNKDAPKPQTKTILAPQVSPAPKM